MKNLHLTKLQLEIDYHENNMTHQEIAEKYGYKTRQVIHRLFKKYNISPKTKSEQGRVRSQKLNQDIPPKNELIELYQSNSISKISRILNVDRSTVSRWMKIYGIETKYFLNVDSKEIVKDYKSLSVKELAIKYNLTTTEIKYKLKDNYPKNTIYDKDHLVKIIKLYDLNNQGFSKQIKMDDLDVLNSILEHTKLHNLYGNKITERIYRILNNYSPNHSCDCYICKDKLKFYTMNIGYGNSDIFLCINCLPSHNGFGFSKVSQKLFWELSKYTKTCKFAENGGEFTITVNNDDVEKYGDKLNIRSYSIDFISENKIIEFDGKYWHQDEEKEKVKLKFLNDKGYNVLNIDCDEYIKNPKETLQKCINFLSNESS